jgi:excisionase family DNA binding protein
VRRVIHPVPHKSHSDPVDQQESATGFGRSGRRPGSRLLTAGQVAELLGVPQTWVYEQSRAGRIPTVNLGRYRRYRREAIEAWLGELEQAATGRAPRRHAR